MKIKIWIIPKPLFLGSVLLWGLSAIGDVQTRGTVMAIKPSMEASRLFARKKNPAGAKSAVYGSYARGCLAGAGRLAVDGPHWQAMRLSRNRNWGHPAILRYIEQFSEDAANIDGWSGLLVGDISQPRGGPMLNGHKSHQIGLDVDIWLTPSPQKTLSMEQRESLGAASVVKGRFELNGKAWTEAHARLLRRAASYPEVARIFVHPTIKKKLCSWAGNDRGWLRRIRAWYGHDDHFHVRLKCPAGENSCVNQDPPPGGDGCGKELAWWLSDEPYRPVPGKKKPKPLILGDLPSTCSSLLVAE